MVTVLFYALLASLCVKSARAAFGQAQELDYLGEKKLFVGPIKKMTTSLFKCSGVY